MTLVNCGLPDPPDNTSDENLPSMNDIIVATDTDTDDDDAYNGYEPLPMSAADNDSLSDSDSEDETNAENVLPDEEALQSISKIEECLLKEVWSAAIPDAVDIEMDNNKVNEVKQAMLNITLPSSSIPEWASAVPEEAWKEELAKRLQNMQRK